MKKKKLKSNRGRASLPRRQLKPETFYPRLAPRAPRLLWLFFFNFAFLIFNSARAASVLIPLQTCGIAPAANRNITLTPLQAFGSNAIPVMDKIQGTTDANGNWSAALAPGVYQADVRPAWGQVGVTEFAFYVDPSNAAQDAFTNLLTGTNNTWPPNQYAYSAQASDARYLQAAALANAVTNTEPGVTLSGTFSGNGSGLANVNAGNLGGLGANAYSLYGSANMRGVLYWKTNWSNLSDFLMVTDGAAMEFYITNNPQGALILASGDSYYKNYLEITNMIGNGIMDGENWSLSIGFKILGTPAGNYTFFIGRQSSSANWIIQTYASISSYGYIQFAKYNGGEQFTATDPNFGIAANDPCTMTFQELGDKFSLIAENNKSNYLTSYTATPGFTNNNGFPPPNSGYFTIHDTGETPIEITSIKITDYSPTNCPLAIVGDSVVEGEMSEYRQYRMASILQKRLGTPIDVFSGDGDSTFEISNDLPYILSFHPATVLLRIGRNDVTFNEWNTQNYSNIVNVLTNAGISVLNLCMEPDLITYPQVNTYLMTNFPATTIPVYNFFTNTMLGADNTHPNPIGYQALADDVAAAMPLFANRYNQIEYEPLDEYQIFGASNIFEAFDGGKIISDGSGDETNVTLHTTKVYGVLNATNSPVNGYTLRYTNGNLYWAPN